MYIDNYLEEKLDKLGEGKSLVGEKKMELISSDKKEKK